MATKERLIVKNLLQGCVGEDAEKERRKSGYERSKRNDLSRGDKKSGRAGSRSKCYRQNDTEI